MERIGVFFGSRSPEHDVSVITGEFILSGLRKLGYPVLPVYLGKKREWHIGEEVGSLAAFKQGGNFDKVKPYYLDLQKSVGKMVFRPKGFFKKEVVVDLAFPAFHGANGEDGVGQGFFEMFGIPYVGCDVASSAIAMDKVLTKVFFEKMGVPTTPFVWFSPEEWRSERQKVLAKIAALRYPLFVKPPRLGSSIGITKVRTPAELENAIEVALHYDSKVLVEEGVEGVTDVTCAVMGHSAQTPSLLQESAFEQDLFSYEDKYLNEGGAQLGAATSTIFIPARIPDAATAAIRVAARDIFRALGCSGIARVDFLYSKEGEMFYANEINPLPGTLYHHLWKESGVEFGDLLQRLIGFAKERQQERAKVAHVFESDILKYADSAKLRGKKL